MVCINSNEKLILQHLLKVLETDRESPLYFFSESDNAVWLEMETWLEKMKQKQMEDTMEYYHIVSGTLNVYDIYANLKMAFQLLKGFVIKSVNLNILISYSNETLTGPDAVNELIQVLHQQLLMLYNRKPVSFKLGIDFYKAYNVFGESRFADTNSSNRIQQFINIHNESENAYLVINPLEKVTGTEVGYLCNYLLSHRKTAEKNTGLPNDSMLQVKQVPVPVPETLEKVVNAIGKGTYHFDAPAGTEKQLARWERYYQEHLALNDQLSFVSQLQQYINL